MTSHDFLPNINSSRSTVSRSPAHRPYPRNSEISIGCRLSDGYMTKCSYPLLKSDFVGLRPRQKSRGCDWARTERKIHPQASQATSDSNPRLYAPLTTTAPPPPPIRDRRHTIIHHGKVRLCRFNRDDGKEGDTNGGIV
jgi:hypothetical protein